ncbi:Rieske (2Fe-2S) protein [Streptomyces johnsoniae]|uniref:Cytochrome bc1 complex Rieske iron-sulfur subunit n=1 Tax=Streptomyces johnsoniae TaxID=3075532 RepID=A0ABU2S1G1_9ACTN|nr:Rieske (2Fe-2S) protein [Streptomyces sp. DSM 41886]MDT0442623.1 Rieske (2Fe-2S) protein [Streptomyces sp. DSM 41886]
MTSRRSVVAAGAAGLTGLLGACGSETGGSEGGGEAGERLGAASDVPEGGGRVFDGQRVVVTQPAAGDFRGFSAVCPHQGCTVSEVRDGTIDCLCHGSKFAIEDGSVVQGPATEPLTAREVTVSGEDIRLA